MPRSTRVAAFGDGWYGFNLSLAEIEERIAALSLLCRQHDRDIAALEIAVSTRDCAPEHIAELEQLGIDELVVVDSPPETPEAAVAWVTGLSVQWGLG